MAHVPTHYHPGSRLLLQLPSGIITVKVLKFFTPFSQSQVLVVQTDKDTPAHLVPRCPFILKVYDSRYRDVRLKYKDIPPWSYESEAEAIRQKPKADPLFDFCFGIDINDAVGWEMRHYQTVEIAFLSESESYKRLQSLQGKAIPRCYGSGRLVLEGRPYFPHILLLEYISDAISIKDYDGPQPSTRSIPFSVMQSLVNTANAFANYGVAHNDLGHKNILLVPSETPNRGVIIDFGEAYCRENESDDDWKTKVTSFWDVGFTIRHFRRRAEFRESLWPAGYDRRSW